MRWLWAAGAAMVIAGFLAIAIDKPPAEKAAAEAAKALTAKTEADAVATEVMRTAVKFQDLARRCAAAARTVEHHLDGDGSKYDLYEVVTEAKDICQGSMEQVLELELPSAAASQAKEPFKTAVSDCARAFQSKAASYERMAKAIDGGLRPGLVQDFREKALRADAQLVVCHAKLDVIASQSGLRVPSLAGIE